MFKSVTQNNHAEYEDRKTMRQRLGHYGVSFLDDALIGILPNDLILLGAKSGTGKTQMCVNIALANMRAGKKVHYIALEAHQYEIERRMKYPLVMDHYLKSVNKPQLDRRVTFAKWMMGDYMDTLAESEMAAGITFENHYKNLFIFYKQTKFGLHELLRTVANCADETDLIMVDHVHYFDFDDDNENRAMKDLAKTARNLVLEENKPIILVAHLRKRGSGIHDMVPDQEEFMGSSDLFKIATRVITMAPGRPLDSGHYETYFRIPKNRIDGGTTRYIAREYYSPKIGGYEPNKYELGWASLTVGQDFETIPDSSQPEWSRLWSGTSRRDIPPAESRSERYKSPSTLPYRD